MIRPDSSIAGEADGLTSLELDLLLEGIQRRYGYDFRGYARSSLKRRFVHRMQQEKLDNLSSLLPLLLHDPGVFDHLLGDLSITVTEMFRDPSFFQVLRERVLPRFRELPYLKIWHAGCATGEEVYSMAILLAEENLYDRMHLYATDYNKQSLQKAERGIYPLDGFQQAGKNYTQSGGRRSFSDYYSAKYDFARLDERLRRNVTFSFHNLVSDGCFGEMDLIVCRNVLIYFDKPLKQRVVDLFWESLAPDGVLCLGRKESIDYLDRASRFTSIDAGERIYTNAVPAPVSP